MHICMHMYTHMDLLFGLGGTPEEWPGHQQLHEAAGESHPAPRREIGTSGWCSNPFKMGSCFCAVAAPPITRQGEGGHLGSLGPVPERDCVCFPDLSTTNQPVDLVCQFAFSESRNLRDSKMSSFTQKLSGSSVPAPPSSLSLSSFFSQSISSTHLC